MRTTAATFGSRKTTKPQAGQCGRGLPSLQSYDAVILDNVARASLSERQQGAIEHAVGEMGLGLIMIGGDRSFGAGEWRGSPVEDALPVEMEIKQEEVIPDGCLVMIVHSSEMGEGNAMAIKVCKKAVRPLQHVAHNNTTCTIDYYV